MPHPATEVAVRAVVLDAGRSVAVRDDVDVVGPGPGDVVVAVRASSLCHSDLHAWEGAVPTRLPLVMGHEAAGEVLEAGAAVTRVRPGDHVVLAMVPVCGACARCSGGQPQLCLRAEELRAPLRFTVGGRAAHGFLGLGTLAERLVVPEASVVPVPGDLPFPLAALLGCGVTTGLGAVLRSAQVRPGESVVVFGCGGVGAAAVQGASLAGAAPVVAVDPVPARRASARALGATHAVPPDEVAEIVRTVVGGGFDHAVDAVGSAATVRAAWDATRRGGTVTALGGTPGQQVTFDARELFFAEKTLRGSVYGSVDARRDIPAFAALWRAGRIDLEALVSGRVPLEETPAALARLRAGEGLREVVVIESGAA